MVGRAARAVRRWSRVPEIGAEPDPRFTFANERTFLAWARTALALMVAGGAIAQFADAAPPGLRASLTIVLISVAAVTGVGGYLRWRRAEVAMRLGIALPRSTGPALFALGVAVVSTGAIVAALIALVL